MLLSLSSMALSRPVLPGLPTVLTSTVTFGSLTGAGLGGAAVPLPDGTYGPITVSGGMATPNVSPLTVGTSEHNGLTVIAEAGYETVLPTELEARARAVPLGTAATIKVRPGEVTGDRINLANLARTAMLTIDAQDRASKPILPGIELVSSNFITVTHVRAHRLWQSGDALLDGVIKASGSSGITVDSCDISSTALSSITMQAALECLPGIATEGPPDAGNGAAGLTVTNCTFTDTYVSIVVEGANITITDNVFTNAYTNFTTIKGHSPGLTYNWNRGEGIWANDNDTGAPHSSLFSMGTVLTKAQDNWTFIGNELKTGSNRFDAKADFQGEARGPGWDEEPTGLFHDGWVVRGNSFGINLSNVTLAKVQNSTFENNTVYFDYSADNGQYGVALTIRNLGSGNNIRNNLGFYFADDGNGDATFYANAFNNHVIYWNDEANPVALFDATDLSDIDLTNVRTYLTPATGSAALIGPYNAGCYGTGYIDHAAQTTSMPTVTKPATSLVTGTELDTVLFDGTNDYFTLAGSTPWQGFTDQKKGRIAFWLEDLKGATAHYKVFSQGWQVNHLADGRLSIVFKDDAGTIVLNVITLATWDNTLGDTAFILSYDMDAGYFEARLGDQDMGIGAITAFEVGASVANNFGTLTVGALNAGAAKIEANVQAVWIGNEMTPFTSDSDLAAWYGQDGNPATLGADGSTPTGTQPAVYLTGVAATWNAGFNLGTGANIAMNGAVTDVSAYAENAVNNVGAASLSTTAMTAGPNFSFAMRGTPDDVSGHEDLFTNNTGTFRAYKSNQNLIIFMRDTAGNTLVNTSVSSVFAAATEFTLEIFVSLPTASTGEVHVYKDGVSIFSATGLTNNGLCRIAEKIWIFSNNLGSGTYYDGTIKEYWLDDAALGTSSIFYNGGTAASWDDLAGVTAHVYAGDGRPATDWDAGTHSGDAVLTVENTGFTEA